LTAPHDGPRHPTLPSGLRLGAPFGIELRLHWSFLLLGGWLALSVLGQTGSIGAVVGLLLIIGLVFGSVALHEYGHALAARRYGIGTREITLLPFGGIAQLVRSPDDPRQELVISAAGPAVNFVLAGLAWAAMGLAGAGATPASGLVETPLLGLAWQVNLVMGVFNLVPALPMDGGRMLRALLALRVSAQRATRIAGQVAQVLAGGMMAYGVVQGRLMLAVIGGFVWISARAEMQRVVLQDALRERARRMGHPVAGATAAPAGEWYAPHELPDDPLDDRDPAHPIRTVGSGTTRRP
jgi:Zn-dependent protease